MYLFICLFFGHGSVPSSLLTLLTEEICLLAPQYMRKEKEKSVHDITKNNLYFWRGEFTSSDVIFHFNHGCPSWFSVFKATEKMNNLLITRNVPSFMSSALHIIINLILSACLTIVNQSLLWLAQILPAIFAIKDGQNLRLSMSWWSCGPITAECWLRSGGQIGMSASLSFLSDLLAWWQW